MARMRTMTGDMVRDLRNRLVGSEKGMEATKIWLVNAWNAWKVAQEITTVGSSTFAWTALRCTLEALRELEDKFGLASDAA